MKSLLPIPQSVYGDIVTSGKSDNYIWKTFHKEGYLQEHQDLFGGEIDGISIRLAIKKLSQIVFETTTACNLKCEYCCYGEGYKTFDSRRQKKGNLRFETAKAIIDYLTNIFEEEAPSNSPTEPFAISFYGGEPLMNFSVIKEIVEYAEKKEFRNRKLTYTMTTNAMLLDRYAQFLQEHNFRLLISLDGNEKHNFYRKTSDGVGSFPKVMSNLKKIRTQYPDWFDSFRYNAVFTNVSNATEIITWFSKEFDKVPNFSPLHTPTKGSKDYGKIKDMFSKFEIPEEYRFDAELMIQSPLNKRVFEFCNRLFGNTNNKEIGILDEGKHLPTGTCIPFSKRMFVSFDGKIHPCEKVNRDLPLGEITDSGKVLIEFERVARDYMSQLSSIRSTCQKCYLQFCCTKCVLCFNGEICEDFMTKKQFVNLLSQTVSYIEKYPKIISLLEDNIVVK